MKCCFTLTKVVKSKKKKKDKIWIIDEDMEEPELIQSKKEWKKIQLFKKKIGHFI